MIHCILHSARSSLHLATMLAILITVVGTGCSRRPAPKPAEGARQTNKDEDRDSKLLDSALGMLSGKLDAESFNSAIAQLNRFARKKPDAIGSLSSEQRDRLTSVFGPQATEIAGSSEFRPEDVETLRTAFLARKLALAMDSASTSKLNLAKQLFEWTIRQIVLVPTDAEERFTPFVTCVRGLGDYRDRMWLFLELLRQVDMQGVVVAASTKQHPDSIVPWLCAALVGEEAYLFDPIAGLPIRKPGGEADSVATLANLLADPLIGAANYPDGYNSVLKASDVDRFMILVPFEPTMLSKRAAFLQSKLVSDARVNLVLDYPAAESRALKLLASAKSSLGAQPWRYPFETIAGQLARRSPNPDFWLARDYPPRLNQIEGNTQEAIRGFVNQDIHPVSVIVDELMNSRLPIEVRRRLLGRRRAGIVYFAGIAQLDANPNDPAVALEWFNRYLADYGTWQFRERDIFEVPVFCRQLNGSEESGSAALAKRVHSALSERSRQLVDVESKVKDRAQFAPRPTVESPVEIQTPTLRMKSEEMQQLIGEINTAFQRADLFAPERIATDLKGSISPTLAMILSRPASAVTPDVVAWRNRLVFDGVFRQSVVPADRPWLVGAVRYAAVTHKMIGKYDEAVELLRRDYPTLAPIQVMSLIALANAWESQKQTAPKP